MPPRLPPLPALNFLRFAAALGVVAAHYRGLGELPGRAWWDRSLDHAIALMSFFFLLSGFVLAYNYRGWFVALTARRTRDFLLLRLARLYPLHLFTFVLSLGLIDNLHHWQYFPAASARRALHHLTLTQTWWPGLQKSPDYNGVSWSLANEWLFYFTLPLLAWAGLRLRPAARLLAGVAGWLAVLGLAWLLRDVREVHYWCYQSPYLRFAEFAAGVLCGLQFAAWRDRVGTPPARPVVGTLRELAALGAAAGLAAFAHWAGPGWVPVSIRSCGYYTPAALLVIVAFARQEGALSRLISGRFCFYLGELSFALYMLHAPLELYLLTTPGLSDWFAGLAYPLRYGGLLTLTLLLTVACHHAVEIPARLWLLRRWGLVRPAPVVPSLQRAA